MIDKLLAMTPLSGAASRRASLGMGLYVASIVLSAALLFSVEPMFTKMVLPRFGGSAAVWSVAIVFFQSALLVGYAYAHLLARYLPHRAGAVIHLLLIGLAFVFLPFAPAEGWTAGGSDEVAALFALFAVSIGVPFVALSANAPLLQTWYARSGLPGSHDPYPLYAASNIGSLGALLAYPLLIEPFAALRGQAWAWSVLYCVLGLLLFLVLSTKGARAPDNLPKEVAEPAGIYTLDKVWRAAFLGFVPSAGLIAVTAHLSTDIAAAPFLWVVPLALYLLTFIVAFGRGPLRWIAPLGRVLPLALGLLGLVLVLELRVSTWFDAALHLTVFFLLALYLHGRLAEQRPASGQLTNFFLAMSFGGVLGGLFAAVIAPKVFSSVAEYPVVLVLGALALPVYGLRIAAALAALLAIGHLVPLDGLERETHRSFFGVHTIETAPDRQFRILRHGLEIHGAQRLRDELGHVPTGLPVPLTYYHEDSPISGAIDAVRGNVADRPLRVGVVGLGTGSISCLVDRTDELTFFEIDALIVQIARDSGKFSFLSACAPKSRIVLGDARLTLDREASTFDLLIIDAFSSDGIPTHLLTQEAMAVYFKRLTPDGVVLFHISNNNLRLNEVVTATAKSLGLAVLINDEDQAPDADAMIYQPTVAVVARHAGSFGALRDDEEWRQPEISRLPRPWTDDYSNLLGALLGKLKEH